MNHLVNHRLSKKQQTRWSPEGAHYLLQVRAELLNGTLPDAAWFGGVVDDYDLNGQVLRVILVATRPNYAQNAPGAYPEVFAIDLISRSWGWQENAQVWVLDKPIPGAMDPEILPTHMLRIPTK
jgi:hypothetical protein